MSLQEDLANIPQVKRGKVWCTVCGREQDLQGNEFAKGWPECHGYTMTLDSPEERQTMEATDPIKGMPSGTSDGS